MTFIIHADESLPDSISRRHAREFHDQTREYWLDWVQAILTFHSNGRRR